MPRTNARPILHFRHEAAPGFRLDRYLLDDLPTAMPPFWPGAWQPALRITNKFAAPEPTAAAPKPNSAIPRY